MDEARDDGEGEAPGDVVVVGVEQPIASPAATSENEHGEEEKQCCKNEKNCGTILLARDQGAYL